MSEYTNIFTHVKTVRQRQREMLKHRIVDMLVQQQHVYVARWMDNVGLVYTDWLIARILSILRLYMAPALFL